MSSEVNEQKAPWNNTTMNILLFATALIPLIGIIVGIIGLFKQEKKGQGYVLLTFGIAVFIVYAFATPVGGIIFGLVFAAIMAFMPQKKCPKCGTQLPKYRKPQGGKQALRGGWTCPGCNSQIDRKGNLIEV